LPLFLRPTDCGDSVLHVKQCRGKHA